MGYKVVADGIVLIHFTWIVFMLTGFFATLIAFHRGDIFDWWILRTIHLLGILYVGLLAVLGKYCPLTILENSFRMKYDPEATYPGSFIIRYLERIVYPDINPWIILIPTFAIALFTLVVYIVRPPWQVRRMIQQ